MIYTNTHELKDHIARHHRTFAGRTASSPLTFRAIMEARGTFRKPENKAVTGISYEAEMEYYDERGHYTVVPTIITLAPAEDGLGYSERRAEAE